MTSTGTFLLILCLVPSIFSASSTTWKLQDFNSSTPQPISDVADGSKIYLSSRDKAVHLAKITLSSNGVNKTLNQLIGAIDDKGFLIGWPVNKDLTITTTNTDGQTKNLTGELFIATPAQAKDPNFLVTAVRAAHHIDRSSASDTTIVFLAVYNQNTDGNPNYAGFKHIRAESFVQPSTTSLSFYRYLPDDNYADVTNLDTVQRRIFRNPLKFFANGALQTTFFSLIDPLQFSQSVWFRAVGGFQLTVSESYVDTTTIQAEAVTVTGMSNSQLLTYNSQVNFMPIGANRLATSGFVVTTELFSYANLTISLNGQGAQSSEIFTGTNQAVNAENVQSYPAASLTMQPNGAFSGLYYVQYFSIDGGPIPTTPAPTTQPPATTTVTPPPVVTSGPSSSTPVVNPASSSSTMAPTASQSTSPQTIQTTTKFSPVSLTMVSICAALVNYVVLHN